MASLTIKEAAERLGISEVTIRRRLRTGQLKGYQESPPTGKWFIEVSDDDVGQDGVGADADDDSLELVDALRDMIKRQDEVIALLKHQLEAREREVQELHVLLQQFQMALPAAGDNRSWWYKLWHRTVR
jgi:DeoR/GlpR family transcriptional regulator of sugar metabolism